MAVSVATDLGATEPRVDLRAVTTNDDTGLAVANDVAGSRVTLRDSVADTCGGPTRRKSKSSSRPVPHEY